MATTILLLFAILIFTFSAHNSPNACPSCVTPTPPPPPPPPTELKCPTPPTQPSPLPVTPTLPPRPVSPSVLPPVLPASPSVPLPYVPPTPDVPNPCPSWHTVRANGPPRYYIYPTAPPPPNPILPYFPWMYKYPQCSLAAPSLKQSAIWIIITTLLFFWSVSSS